MTSFRRVEARFAGANALGILVPPGERTLVIVRPRSLPWDLLPARWSGEDGSAPVFCAFEREEAAHLARRFGAALESGMLEPLESFGRNDVLGLWLRVENYLWVVCRRRPGEAYEPALFSSAAEAEAAAVCLEPFLRPAADAGQEYYFNTQQFTG